MIRYVEPALIRAGRDPKVSSSGLRVFNHVLRGPTGEAHT